MVNYRIARGAHKLSSFDPTLNMFGGGEYVLLRLRLHCEVSVDCGDRELIRAGISQLGSAK